MKQTRTLLAVLLCALTVRTAVSAAVAATHTEAAPRVRVFILSGQSNMEGHGFIPAGRGDEAASQHKIVMEFDQPVTWNNALASQFYLDGKQGQIASGSVSGKFVKLQLAAAAPGPKLTYLDSKSWSQTNLLRGENGIAALTFCEVPISPQQPGLR